MSGGKGMGGHHSAEAITFLEVLSTRSFYACTCGEEWSEVWCCSPDDDCPACGAEISPHEIEDGETFTIRAGVDLCPICHNTHEF